MKIIILGTAHPYRGGLASYNERLAQQLLTEGHEVEILTFTMQYPGFLFPGKTQYTDSPAPKGLDISRVLNSVNPFNWIRTGCRIRKEKPDILIIKYWHPFMAPCFGAVTRKVLKNRHTKVICIFDNVIPHEKTFIDKLLTAYFVKSISGAVVMSGSVGDDLKEFSVNIPVAFNPHPLYDNYGTLMNRGDALKKLDLDPSFAYFLFFGFIRSYKGLDLLLEAFADRRFRNQKCKLIVAGEFYESDSVYMSIIEKNGLADEVILHTHFIGEDEVACYFSAADLVVQPYRSATQSGVTQIAYHFEKPMLVTDVGGLSEIVIDGKSGYVVSPHPEKIADAMYDFLVNRKAGFFTRGVMEEKTKFTWEKLTGTIIKVFGETKLNTAEE